MVLLTPARLLDTVRRFREYPERAVRKRLWLQGFWPALYGYKRFTAGFVWIVEDESVILRIGFTPI
jgi:hypothetical protein